MRNLTSNETCRLFLFAKRCVQHEGLVVAFRDGVAKAALHLIREKRSIKGKERCGSVHSAFAQTALLPVLAVPQLLHRIVASSILELTATSRTANHDDPHSDLRRRLPPSGGSCRRPSIAVLPRNYATVVEASCRFADVAEFSTSSVRALVFIPSCHRRQCTASRRQLRSAGALMPTIGGQVR